MKKLVMTKNLKPIDQDLHLKYICPNNKCGYAHWLSLQETQIKAFKVVCTCGQVFSPKRISRTKIVYKKLRVSKKQETQKPTNHQLNKTIDFEQKCAKILESYGFSKSECKLLITKAQTEYNFDNPSSLLKHILLNLPNFGEN